MRIGFLITARLKSTRLPLKIMKDLNGKPVIQRIVERALGINHIAPEDVVICTSAHSQDKPLLEIAQKTGVSSFLGAPDDVLKRLHDAALSHELTYALGITADNPLFSIEYANKIVDIIQKNPVDFVKIVGLPFGAAPWGMNINALKTIIQVKTIVDTEIWGYLIDRPEIFKVHTIQTEPALQRPQYRLTLDYPEDYKLLNHLYSHIPFTTTLPLSAVVQYLDVHPEVVAINSSCIQLDLPDDVKEKIERNYHDNFIKIKKIKDEIYAKTTAKKA